MKNNATDLCISRHVMTTSIRHLGMNMSVTVSYMNVSVTVSYINQIIVVQLKTTSNIFSRCFNIPGNIEEIFSLYYKHEDVGSMLKSSTTL